MLVKHLLYRFDSVLEIAEEQDNSSLIESIKAPTSEFRILS